MLSRLAPRPGRAGSPDPVTTDLLRLRVAAGVVGGDERGLSDRCRRAVRVASAVGAPLLDAIDGAAAAEDDQRRARRAVQVASAQTRAVAAGLIGAPVLLVPGLGKLVGADLAGFYRSPVGMVVLAIGLLMLACGAAVVGWLVRRVGRPVASRGEGGPAGVAAAALGGWLAWRVIGVAAAPLAALLAHHIVASRRRPSTSLDGLDEAADLTATALAGGVSTSHALRLAAVELPALAEPLHRLAFDLELGLPGGTSSDRLARAPEGRDEADGRPTEDGLRRLRAVLVTATSVGAAAAPTLRRLARDLRADELARVLAAAERLPAQLTFPTALCLLPATVLLVGAPIVHAGLSTVGT